MRSLTELQRLDFPDLLPPIEPVWLGDKGPSGHSSHGCSVSAQAIMGMGSVGGGGGGCWCPLPWDSRPIFLPWMTEFLLP